MQIIVLITRGDEVLLAPLPPRISPGEFFSTLAGLRAVVNRKTDPASRVEEEVVRQGKIQFGVILAAHENWPCRTRY